MGALADFQINARVHMASGNQMRLVIRPFVAVATRDGVLPSYGLTSYGYDIRLAPEFKLFGPDPEWAHLNGLPEAEYPPPGPDAHRPPHVLDPCSPENVSLFRHLHANKVVIPPNSFVLGRSLEWIEMPDDVIAIVTAKSTYARSGIGIPITPIEPGWRGNITIEVVNHTRLPAVVHAHAGIAQLVFIKGDAQCTLTYASKPGALYQDQAGITPARSRPPRSA